MNEITDSINLLNLDTWNATETSILSYIKTPIQNTFFANNSELIGTALRQSIIYFAETLNTTDRLSCTLGNEFRSTRTHKYQVLCPPDNKTGETTTPMEITTFAPIAFEYLRTIIGISRNDFHTSFDQGDFISFANTGRSGSQMYKTQDDAYVIKTLRDHEAKLLLQTLSGLYLRYSHTCSLMTRYVGLYSVNIRSIFSSEIYCVVMLNNLPSVLDVHEVYDLKGSSVGRFSSIDLPLKRLKALKDLDFESFYPYGIRLPHEIYRRLRLTLENDIFDLRKMMITDYSLMLGIHHLDDYHRDNENGDGQSKVKLRPQLGISSFLAAINIDRAAIESPNPEEKNETDNESNEKFITKFIMKPLHLIACPQEDTFTGNTMASSLLGIPGLTHDGHRVLLYPALIDCLQTFDYFKRVQHTLQNLRDPKRGAEYSVIQPDEYEKRILRFLFEKVFVDSKQTLEELLASPNICDTLPDNVNIERCQSINERLTQPRESFDIIQESDVKYIEETNGEAIQTTEVIQSLTLQPLTPVGLQ
ncbi:unnamed protein product [Adineta ricciae]|uniref:PIPK domain-containing protein n=1 Tax=Adineta ricciae TaxID=249248 RepID=A0A814AS54_ADIRI|nr:unnamed protein product [Adineta ricciae]CAF0941164.1 unnamed protein product [Adineta ricciae]